MDVLMTIISKFDVLDKVVINDLGSDIPARVESVVVGYGNTMMYNVEYWLCGELETVCLHEDELSKKGERHVKQVKAY